MFTNQNSLPVVSHRHRGRTRGFHSNRCKCPDPVYFRSTSFKNLPGELGRAYRKLVGYDEAGQPYLKRHVSRDIFFIQYRHMTHRNRDFRPERRKLLDSLWPLLISKLDLTTGLVTICLTTIARELSVNDDDKAVTPSRISRLIQELVNYGLLEVQPLEWDGKNNMFLPKYVALTKQGWMLTGCNVEKLYREQQHRLDALSSPDYPQSVTQARQAWLAKKRLNTLINRKHAISCRYQAARLLPLSSEERQHVVASWLCKKLTITERELIKDKFKRLVCQKLFKLVMQKH